MNAMRYMKPASSSLWKLMVRFGLRNLTKGRTRFQFFDLTILGVEVL